MTALDTDVERLHGTAVSIGGRGVLILGPSGSGKSDLALRLIDRGALMVADDQVLARRREGAVELHCPETIRGRMEVRGLGVVETPAAPPVPLALAVELGDEVERMPERRGRVVAGVEVPLLRLDPLPASAPIKLEWALRRLGGGRP